MVEQAVERFQQGGYINGDYVKFVPNIKSTEFFKTQSKQIQDKIQEMIDGDLYLRVCAIKSARYPQNRVDGGLNAATDFYIDVVVEYAPGLYKDPVTVPSALIELVDTPDAMGRMPPPESTVYKANIHGAEELTSDDVNRSNPKKDTKISGGNKWVDKPGGGGGDGMKPVKENKDDISALTEAYESIYIKKSLNEQSERETGYFLIEPDRTHPFNKNAQDFIGKISELRGTWYLETPNRVGKLTLKDSNWPKIIRPATEQEIQEYEEQKKIRDDHVYQSYHSGSNYKGD